MLLALTTSLTSSSAASWLTSLRSPRTLALLGLGAVTVGSIAWYRFKQEEPDPVELERERRDFLSTSGRIVDGPITDTRWGQSGGTAVPNTLIYRYSTAGVEYECAQDVTPLLERVRHVRTDLPVQVRFDPRNPSDSIVVAEAWSGLRIDREHASLPEPDAQPVSLD